jgi:hypothetical protein
MIIGKVFSPGNILSYCSSAFALLKPTNVQEKYIYEYE